MSTVLFKSGRLDLAAHGWTGRSFRVALISGDYVPKPTHSTFARVTRFELKGIKRATISDLRVELDDDRVSYSAPTVTFKGLASKQSYRWVVIFAAGVIDADAPLIVALDMGEVSLRAADEHSICWNGDPKRGRVFSQG